MKNYFVICLTYAFGLNLVYGLDEKAAFEMKCPALKIDSSFKMDLITAIPKWYFPIWSKLGKYRMASLDLGKSVAEITEADLIDDCETFTSKNSESNGFHHTGVHITQKLENDGAISYKADDNNVLFGKTYVVLTDSKDFSVAIQCWNDNQASWLVTSRTPTLSPENREKATNYLKSVGFDMKNLIEESYDHCDDPVPSASFESFESSEEHTPMY